MGMENEFYRQFWAAYSKNVVPEYPGLKQHFVANRSWEEVFARPVSLYAGVRRGLTGPDVPLVEAGLVVIGPHRERTVHALQVRRRLVGPEFADVEWMERPESVRDSMIRKVRRCNPDDREEWPSIHKWIAETLVAFRSALG